jgi:hypothetical protein
MQLAQPVINKLKKSLTEMRTFREKMFANHDSFKYNKELLELSGLMGLIEAIIEISEKK